jgi:hypothetical protein
MCYEFCESGLYWVIWKKLNLKKIDLNIFKNNLVHKDEIYYAYKYIYIHEN